MDSRNVEFRSVIKFLLKKDMNAKEIIHELQNVYKEESPSKSFVYTNGSLNFNEEELVLTNHPGGRPSEIGDDKEEAIATIVRKKRRIGLSVRNLAAYVNVSSGPSDGNLKWWGINFAGPPG